VPTSKPQPDGTLVKALAQAWRWQKLLDEGVYTTISEIGDAENISKSYVSRILRLTLVTPDILEAIVAGRAEPVADAGEAGAANPGPAGRSSGACLASRIRPDTGRRRPNQKRLLGPSAVIHTEDAGIGARRPRIASAERAQVKGRGAWLCSAR
jgi:hypothetical protein